MGVQEQMREELRVLKARTPSVSWREVAEVIGCHEQNVYKTYLRNIDEGRFSILKRAIETAKESKREF